MQLFFILCTNDYHENLQIWPMYLFLYLYKCNPFVALLVMQLIENLVNLNNANTPMVILFFLPKQEKPIYIYIYIDKGVLIERFKVWHTRKPMAPMSSLASHKRIGPKATTPQNDDGPAIPNNRLYEVNGKFQMKQETNEVRRPTGAAWLGLISINISSRKYLASHD